jgi:hypothetical protein
MASEAGKGSKQRPTDKTSYDESYDRIFKKKKSESLRSDVYYDSDSDNINDIRYDVKYIPEDRYDE